MSDGGSGRRRFGTAERLRGREARRRRAHRLRTSRTDAGYRVECIFGLTGIASDFVARFEFVALARALPYQFVDAHPHDPLRLIEVLELPRVVRRFDEVGILGDALR